jgi:hypothetical protein
MLDLTKDPELRIAILTLAARCHPQAQGAGCCTKGAETCHSARRPDLPKLYTNSVSALMRPLGCSTPRPENQLELEEDSCGLTTDEDGRKFVCFMSLGPHHKSSSSSWSKKSMESSEEDNLYVGDGSSVLPGAMASYSGESRFEASPGQI